MKNEMTKALGLEYVAEFVPKRLSRNAASKDPSINWRVTFAKDGKAPSPPPMTCWSAC